MSEMAVYGLYSTCTGSDFVLYYPLLFISGRYRSFWQFEEDGVD